MDRVPGRLRGGDVDAVHPAQPGGARDRPARLGFAFHAVVAAARRAGFAEHLFAASSVVTPFFMGTVVGAIAAGRVPLGNAAGDPWSSWLNPVSILVGVLFVATGAYLAAVFLIATPAAPATRTSSVTSPPGRWRRRRHRGARGCRDLRPPRGRPLRLRRAGLRRPAAGDRLGAVRDRGAGAIRRGARGAAPAPSRSAPWSRSSGAGASPSTPTCCRRR